MQPTTRKPVGASVASAHCLVLVIVLMAGCGKSPAEQYVDKSIKHLDAAEEMMRTAEGKLEVLIDQVNKYRMDHRQEFKQLREAGEQALAKMAPDDRSKLQTDAQTRAMAVVNRMENLSQQFKQPEMALRVVRPLLIVGTPKAPPPGRRSLLPKIPALPNPNAVTPTHHRHVH